MQYSVQRADSGRDMEECSTVCRELIQAGIWRMQYSVQSSAGYGECSTGAEADSGRDMEECSTVCRELIQTGIWRNAVQCAES